MKKTNFKKLCKSYGLKPKKVKAIFTSKVKHTTKREVLVTIYIHCQDLFKCKIVGDFVKYKDFNTVMKLSKDFSEVV